MTDRQEDFGIRRIPAEPPRPLSSGALSAMVAARRQAIEGATAKEIDAAKVDVATKLLRFISEATSPAQVFRYSWPGSTPSLTVIDAIVAWLKEAGIQVDESKSGLDLDWRGDAL